MFVHSELVLHCPDHAFSSSPFSSSSLAAAFICATQYNITLEGARENAYLYK